MPRAELKLPTNSTKFIPSGSTLLNLILGGGWAQGRVANIVGDKSAGKTLLAIEAAANFARYKAPQNIAYRECENAFDQDYAHSIGLPKKIDFNDEIRTIQDFERDLVVWLDRSSGPSLYILDSLDALSSDAEMEREEGEASYGTEKAKALSELFRKRIGLIQKTQCTVLIISQIRDNIGVRFGETKKRSGGRALDFYASQVIWLAEIKKIKRTITKVDRITGVHVLINNKKNKVGMPFRQAAVQIYFAYGVDDELSMVDWLKENKGDDILPRMPAEYPKLIANARNAGDRDAIKELHQELASATIARWEEIEEALKPSLAKYG